MAEELLPHLAAGALQFRGLKEQEATETTEQSVSVSSVFSVFNDLSMHPLFAQASGITHDVMGAAIEVHKDKGPGLKRIGLRMVSDDGARDSRLQDRKPVRVRHSQGMSRLILPGANLD